MNKLLVMFEKRKFASELGDYIEKKVTVAGWVHDVRLLGGINFILLRDRTGFIQIIIPKKNELVKKIKNVHQEDVIVATGKVKKSLSEKTEFEILPEEIEILSRAEVPLPLDPREITKTNLDTKLNWRFMYFRTEEAKAIFKIQTEITRAFREFFLSNGFVEMQPPIIIATASEGGAELFPLPYFDKQAYLAQSPQLYKQMGAISFERVFMITPVFRAEKFDQPTHLNEIRQMDVEIGFTDDEGAMDWLEKALIHILKRIKENGKKELKYLGIELNVPKSPFLRVTYKQAIEKLKEAGEKIEYGDDFSKTQERKLGEIFGEVFFLKDWPEEQKAFYAMPKEDNPKVVKAFDLIYKGLEISSGTQRIHIPKLLEERIRSKGLNPKNFKYYIDAFRYGAPPHAGWSIGLERLTMQICNKKNIKEVTMFPRTKERILP